MKKSIFITGIFFLISCNSTPKRKKTSDMFIKDSVFLKQGRQIENYREPVKNKIKKSQNIRKIIKKKENNKTKKEKEFPFKVGEEVTLSVFFFGVEAGKILIGVDNFKKFEGKKQYHFYIFGKTSSIFSMFYKVKNKIESLWDPEIKKPRSLALDALETKQKYKVRVYFDWLKKTGNYFEEGWSKKKKNYRVQKKWTLHKKSQDVVSAIFYVRTLPLLVGKEYKVPVMKEDKTVDVHFKVERKEILKTRIGKIKTLVLTPRFSTKGKFKQVGDIRVWLTDDSFRQVVRIESKIKIGRVVAKLHSIKRF